MNAAPWWNELGLFGLLVGGSCLSLAIGWRRSRNANGLDLPTWRRQALRIGLIGNALALTICLADLVRLQLVMRRVVGYTGSGWADTWALTALFVLVLASTISGAFGSGLGRLLTIVAGILLAVLWFFLSLSTIP